MKALFLALALVSTSALAGVENMVAQCEAVMRCPLCGMANSAPATGDVWVTIKGGKPRKISAADYNFFQSAGYTKVGKRHLMCVRIEEEMTKNPTSNRSLAARAKWDMNWKPMEYCP
jgi:hypothetical protein